MKTYYFKGNKENGQRLMEQLVKLSGATNDRELLGTTRDVYYYNDPVLGGVCGAYTGESIQRLKEIGTELNSEQHWRAKKWGKYYWIGSSGVLQIKHDMFDTCDNSRYTFGNYFQTREEATQYAIKFRKLLQGRD